MSSIHSTLKSMLFILLATILASSCQKDSETSGSSGTALNFARVSYEESETSTKAVVNGNSTTFQNGDALGFFLRGTAYSDVDNRQVVYQSPNKWIIQGDKIILKANNAIVTGYFPYSSSGVASVMPLAPGAYDVNTNDFVWQRATVNQTNPAVTFSSMNHALTRVRITMKRATGTTASSVKNVSIADAGTVPETQKVIYSSGTIDLAATSPSATGTTVGSVSIATEKTLSTGGTIVYDFLLLPVANIGGSDKLALTADVDNEILSCTFPATPASWEPGKAYDYTVTVNAKKMLIKYVGSTVNDWSEENLGHFVGDADNAMGTISDETLTGLSTSLKNYENSGFYSASGDWTGALTLSVWSGAALLAEYNVMCGATETRIRVPANATTDERTIQIIRNIGGAQQVLYDGKQDPKAHISSTAISPIVVEQKGGTVTLTFKGFAPYTGLAPKAICSDPPVTVQGSKQADLKWTFALPPNNSWDPRNFAFEYLIDGDYETAKETSVKQKGYEITSGGNFNPRLSGMGGSTTYTMNGYPPDEILLKWISEDGDQIQATAVNKVATVKFPPNYNSSQKKWSLYYTKNGNDIYHSIVYQPAVCEHPKEIKGKWWFGMKEITSNLTVMQTCPTGTHLPSRNELEAAGQNATRLADEMSDSGVISTSTGVISYTRTGSFYSAKDISQNTSAYAWICVADE